MARPILDPSIVAKNMSKRALMYGIPKPARIAITVQKNFKHKIEPHWTKEPYKDILDSRQKHHNYNAADPRGSLPVKDSIILVNYTLDKTQSTKGYSYIELPFVPNELSYEPQSNFVAIASMGRNNPHYHFTGSEDTLNFTIDWFAMSDPSREEVIKNCRWVEALSKNDGYFNAPPQVKLSWGKDNKLFQDAMWLCTAAPYKLMQFTRGYYEVQKIDDNGRLIRGEFKNTSLLPQMALQQVTLKRITETNLRTAEIQYGNKVNSVPDGAPYQTPSFLSTGI